MNPLWHWHTCILPIFPLWLWVLCSYQERSAQDWCSWSMEFVIRNQMVLPCGKWRGEMDNRATTPVGHSPSTAFLPVRPHCVNARKNSCQEDLKSFPFDNWMRPPGCPRTTWMETIQQDLKSSNLSVKEAIVVAQNHPLWRLMSAFGATHW